MKRIFCKIGLLIACATIFVSCGRTSNNNSSSSSDYDSSSIVSTDSSESIHSHKLEHVSQVSATCMNAGNIEYWYCTVCHKYFRDQQCLIEVEYEDTIIEPAHFYDNWETIVEVTCEHDGERKGYCKFCNQPITEILPKYDHSYIWRQTEISHWQVCENGCSYESIKEEHDWDTNNHCKVCNYNLPYSKGLAYTERKDENDATIAYSVSKGTCRDKNVIIPAFYNNLPVTVIERSAFENDSNLNSVILSSSITDIHVRSFGGCTSLKEVTIGTNVTLIGSSAFANCISLERVNWYAEHCENVIGKVFDGCEKLSSFMVGDNVKYFPDILSDYPSLEYTEEDGALYLGNDNNPYVLLYKSASNELTTFSLKLGTHIIYHYAFKDCLNLISVSTTENLYSIGSYSFSNCNKLESIEFGNNLEWIGQYAFYKCSSLTSIVIPNRVTSIGGSTFFGCSSLTSIVIPNSVTSIGGSAFKCESIKNVYFNGTIEDWCNIKFSSGIGGFTYTNWDFYINGNLLENLVIPNGITEIKAYTFAGCQSLKSVIIPDSVTLVQDYSFSYCKNLSNVSLGNGLIYLGDEAFPRNGVLKYNEYGGAYYLGNDSNPFFALVYGKETAKTCIVNNLTKTICSKAFYNHKYLSEVTIERNVIYIGSYAFGTQSTILKATFVDPERWTRENGHTGEIENISASSLKNTSTAAKLIMEKVVEVSNPGTVSQTTYHWPYLWNKMPNI